MTVRDLVISLDRAEAVYAPGDSIVGVVHVSTSAPVDCKKPTVKLNWRTEGTSNPDQGAEVQEQMLFVGRWEEGQRVSFRFEVTAPPGPFSYQGRLFDVEWYVQASVNLPSMRDVHAEQKVQIVPRGAVAEANFGPQPPFADDVIGVDPKQTQMGFRARYIRGREGRGIPSFFAEHNELLWSLEVVFSIRG